MSADRRIACRNRNQVVASSRLDILAQTADVTAAKRCDAGGLMLSSDLNGGLDGTVCSHRSEVLSAIDNGGGVRGTSYLNRCTGTDGTVDDKLQVFRDAKYAM